MNKIAKQKNSADLNHKIADLHQKMKRPIVFVLFLGVWFFSACQKERKLERERPGQEEPGERSGYLTLEIDGKKYEWRETALKDECFDFSALFIRGQRLLTFSVSESAQCAGRNEQMSFGMVLTAESIGGVYRIESGMNKRDQFQLNLPYERYSAASWLYTTDMQVVINVSDPQTGVIEGTLEGTVAKYIIAGKHENYLRMVPMKGVFRLKMVTLNSPGI